MTYYKYWTIIIFVIDVSIIFNDRRHSGVLQILLKKNLHGFFVTFADDTGIYGVDFFNEARSIPNISLFLLGINLKSVSI